MVDQPWLIRARRQNGLMAALIRIIARHPVVAFMVMDLGAGFLTAAIRPIAEARVLPFGPPPHGFFVGLLGVGVGAFVVTGALAGREDVVDLARRSVRWRVPVRLVALFTVPVSATLLSLAIYVRDSHPLLINT
jgi:hypothetical protein